MDLIDRLKTIGENFEKTKKLVGTEEATKNAFVMPFIMALGYDVFNPLEVVPEFIADVGSRKGEKVDYCILTEGKPSIIIECKHWDEKLENHNAQLFRYFGATSAKVGILTNGHVYRFYTDLEEANKMDEKPFYEFNVSKVSDSSVNELKRFHKESFNIDSIFGAANNLKYSKELRDVLKFNILDPDTDFIKYLIKRVHKGNVTAKVVQDLTPLVEKAVKFVLSESFSEKISIAIENDEKSKEEEEVEEVDVKPKTEIITTDEERSGYRIVQAILTEVLEPQRVKIKDNRNYCGIIIDDSSRKQICRLHFNRAKKYIGIFDQDKNETRELITNISDIYKYKDQLIKTAEVYLN